MAIVKTFRISKGVGIGFGVPDAEISDFISAYEQSAIVSVTAVYIPALGTADPRLTIILTKLDDFPVKENNG